jgi:hypothetical protein
MYLFLRINKCQCYTIKLCKLEIEDLNKVINNGSYSSQAFWADYISLNCDKGEFSDNTEITIAEICTILKVDEGTNDRMLNTFYCNFLIYLNIYNVNPKLP